MSLKVLVTAQLTAKTSDAFFVPQNQAVSIHCTPDLVSAEEAVVEISLDNDIFVDYEDDVSVKLHATKNALRLYGPAFYKVAKGATVSATAIHKLD